MTRSTGVAFCLVLFLALANCRSFEDIVHKRGLKRIRYCYNYQTGSDWYGNDLNPQPITGLRDAYACCAECNSRYPATVRAYIYRTDYGHCYCKRTVSAPTDCAVCQGSDNYEPAPTCTTQSGVDSYGNDLRGPIENVMYQEDCCAHCHRYGSRCVAWVWRSDYNRCYLKSEVVPRTNCPNCVFGEP